MNTILAIPLPLRLLVLMALGSLVGGLVNWCVYRLAWQQRSISPWSPPPRGATRGALDRLPVYGWWRLRREAKLHGARFWIRPLMVDLVCAALFAGVYWWVVVDQHAVGVIPLGLLPRADFLTSNIPLVTHAQYVSQIFLIVMMLAASLIDFDEKTIPDAITVPGTLIGLALAALYPWSLLGAGQWLVAGGRQVEFLALTAPLSWLNELDGWPPGQGLKVAGLCWTLWCFGLMPRRWNRRRGLTTAVRVFVHRLLAERLTYVLLVLWLAGLAILSLAAWRLPAAHWAGLLTALVGMAGGGGMIWAVRVVGSAALGREAMGFGDVTLMAMVGAFLGWQPALMIFFVAPFLGLVVGVTNAVLQGEHEIPYGPFLCLASFGLLINWAPAWEVMGPTFELGSLLPLLMAACLGLMGGILWMYRLARDAMVGKQ